MFSFCFAKNQKRKICYFYSGVVYFQKPEDFLLKKKPSAKKMELWAWGSNNYGQLGLGHINEQYEEPVQVQTYNTFYNSYLKNGFIYFSLIMSENHKPVVKTF